jgi:hypothetical protein
MIAGMFGTRWLIPPRLQQGDGRTGTCATSNARGC